MPVGSTDPQREAVTSAGMPDATANPVVLSCLFDSSAQVLSRFSFPRHFLLFDVLQ